MKIEKQIKFNIDLPDKLIESEYIILKEWLNTLTHKDLENPVWFRFVRSSGIGVSVYAMCNGIEKDITDYTKW